jgi:alkanesulfonate monooxygenase SsuD/methylene tetrahydromethanopterin reductase-like flavin-dependent oxidoreductase (luciferase family)
MIGSMGERMLHIALPYVDSWNVWFNDIDNRPAGVPPLRELVDGICREVGRDPAAVERTVAVQVRLSGGMGRPSGNPLKPSPTPIAGTTEQLAESMRAFAREGIGHVQLVMDPITEAAIAEFAPVLEELDQD